MNTSTPGERAADRPGRDRRTASGRPAARSMKPPVFSKSTFVHLRLAFFFYLTPVFLFSLAVSPRLDWLRAGLAFFIIHFLLYPASNGFNSYYDRDEKGIGGIRNPPAVTPDLLLAVNLLDLLAVGLGFILGRVFSLGLLFYIIASRLYSWDKTRLKRRPVLSWLMVGLGQGTAVFLMSFQAVNKAVLSELLSWKVCGAALLAGFFLLASYPMTQVYQHEEDRRRGDRTMSMLLGVRGTFLFCFLALTAVASGYASYFFIFSGKLQAAAFLLCLVPSFAYFIAWRRSVLADESRADFRRTMAMNTVTSLGLNLFFVVFLLFSR